MSAKTFLTRSIPAALAVACAAHAGSALAMEFELYDNTLKVENLFTLGASWRTTDPDPSLIGKSELYAMRTGNRQGLCLERTSQSASQDPTPQASNAPRGTNVYVAGTAGSAVGIGRVCTTSSPTGQPAGTLSPENQAYVAAPGSFSPNGDNGDLNFKKGDLVHAIAKLTTDVNYSFADYNFFVRGVALFDANYSDFTETHVDSTMQADRSELPTKVERLVGVDYDLLDYNIGHNFAIGDRELAVKVGNQVLNWGESSLLALNSLNTINPPDARRLAIPGLDLKEAFRPIGMVTLGTEIVEGINIDTFYTYDWKPIMIDPVGTFFSQSDTLGEGGDYAMLSFGKSPEDPGYATTETARYRTGKRGYYRPIDTCSGPGSCADSLGLLGSTASRTVFRDHAEERRREPNGGDYGATVKMFLESINNGTELAFYAANYDSRIPVVSAFAAHNTCLSDDGNAATSISNCGIAPGAATPSTFEPIPVDTMALIVEYPKDIHLFGMSFNTTVGDYALSGEYAYRPNLPIQVDTVDLTYTALQPAFPAQDISTPALVIPGRRSAFPSFLTGYLGYKCSPTATNDADCIQDGQYIPGFQRFKVGQANLTVLRLIGGDNPIAASQMTMLLEMGMQQVFDMPPLSKLQLDGTGSHTPISGGAAGTPGVEPAGAVNTNNALRQNPTANKDMLGYGTSESYGFRFLNLNRWESALFGMINLETLAIARVDVKGTSPGIGTNFSEGRKQFNFGLRGDYLSTYIAEIRYSWFTGGGHHDGQRDRDNIQVSFGYQF